MVKASSSVAKEAQMGESNEADDRKDVEAQCRQLLGHCRQREKKAAVRMCE